ncbi:MAG: oligoribonuclease [Porticoccus sp.]|jgi:oligoribonuclease
MNSINEAQKDSMNLIWIDLEMTGLDTINDAIIEIATIVTDKDPNILGEGPIFAINQTNKVLEGMDEWNTRQHHRSGLTERVRSSKVSLEEAERDTVIFLEQFVDAGVSPMCGNSICQDRRFLSRQMPALEDFFHYRNLDVSSINEIAKRWRPEILEGFKKKSSHLAMDDIKDSIAELRHYRHLFFNVPETA